MRKIIFSVIIPLRTITPYVRETICFLKKQQEKNFEIILVTDKKEKAEGAIVITSEKPTPAYKRNLGAKKAKGQFLAFLDDDSYPENDWLKNASIIFNEDKNIAAVCGPSLIPPKDNLFQKASGLVWASWIGSGGAGVYRNKISQRREVDDFPSVNLLMRKSDFEKVNGFDINHWPGEDTKLCLDIIKTGKKIIYDPSVIVFHHRRPVFLPHLKQISRYAVRRGYFAKVFPETSRRWGYFFPSIFTYGLILGLFLVALFPVLKIALVALLTVYLIVLLSAFFNVLFKEKNFILAVLVLVTIFLTHFVYGLLFPWGYLQKELKLVPHKIDLKKKVYIGG